MTNCGIKLLLATVAITTIAVLGSSRAARASGASELRFENRRFVPQTLNVPANQRLTIRVVNASNETIEFESFKLNREKAISPGEAITVHLPALSAGSYDFYDDFHQDVPQGTIVAK